MSLPGPGGVLWPLGLLVFVATFAVVGEAVRLLLSRFLAIFRTTDLFERALVDVYLGGAALFVLAWIPPGLFYPATLPLLLLVSVVGLWARWFLAWRVDPTRRPTPLGLRSAWRWLAIAAALGLFAVEVAAAEAAPTGNTYDSSLFTSYTTLLIAHHVLPTMLAPFAAQPIPYPQGSTVWFASAQLLFGLPPARVALLVTPVFFALTPLAAFVAGRRLLGSESSGAAFALTFALLGTWSRGLLSGSNDFALAFPLVLLLIGWSAIWWRERPPTWGDAAGFGILTGCSAALSPVGAEVLLLALPLGALLAAPRFGGSVRTWFARWGGAALAAVPFVLPSLVIEVANVGRGFPETRSASVVYGLSASQWLGSVDPFLFRPTDVALSPFPLLRIELALLLIAGALVLVLGTLGTDGRERLGNAGRAVAATAVSSTALLVFELLPRLGVRAATPFARLSSPQEVSILLFTSYTLIAALPLAFLFVTIENSTKVGRDLPKLGRWRPDPATGAGWATCALLAGAVLVPGLAVTATSFPSYASEEYRTFGNVTAGDFALLSWAEGNLPEGARVLVAPGSAAQFLPGYDPSVVLLFPVTVLGASTNGSYSLLVRELSNGTLDAAGTASVSALHVGYIAVTQVNSQIWPAFDPAPLLGNPHDRLVYSSGDAYLFLWTG